MLLKTAIKKLESSKTFKDFHKKNKDFFLAHAFCMIDKIQSDWQIGYYNNDNERVVVFSVGKAIKQNPEEEVFKKPKTKIKSLDMKKVKVNLEKAVNISEKLVKKKYSAETVNKTICILQHLETELYNLTLVSQTLNIINIKIDANSGKILNEQRQSILNLRKE